MGLRYSSKFMSFIERATEAKACTPWTMLSDRQKKGLMKKMSMQIKDLWNQLSAAQRRLVTASRRLADYQRIMMMLATHDYANLQRMLSVALRHGSSPAAIIGQLQRAFNGLYAPRTGYTERDIDLAFIAKSLGGPRLLYALQKGKGFVSERTVRRHRPIPKLHVSIGTPSAHDCDTNLDAVMNPEIRPPAQSCPGQSDQGGQHRTLPGNILMFDGIALEGRCRYCPKRDSVLGFCREHGKIVYLKCDSVEAIQKLKDLVNEGKLCFGSDATVVAIAPYTETDHYTPVPIILSPTDKTEKGEDMMIWIQKVLDSWEKHQFGAQINGPIWAIASDGDPSFRLAKHLLCMTTDLDMTSPLGQKLGELQYIDQ